MTKHIATLATAIALSATDIQAAPDAFVVDKAHSEVGFRVRHMLSKTAGRFADRDKHLRSADFFDVENHPELVFQSESVRRTGKDRYDVTGTLSIRGIGKRITLPVTYLGQTPDPWGGTRAGFSTEVKLNRKDFGIVWNKALDQGGFVLGDDVWVTLEIEAIKEKTAS